MTHRDLARQVQYVLGMLVGFTLAHIAWAPTPAFIVLAVVLAMAGSVVSRWVEPDN
jgi:DMSO reductase anchor subunit